MAYQEAVYYALRHTNPENTLIISTADHSHSIESEPITPLSCHQRFPNLPSAK